MKTNIITISKDIFVSIKALPYIFIICVLSNFPNITLKTNLLLILINMGAIKNFDVYFEILYRAFNDSSHLDKILHIMLMQ